MTEQMESHKAHMEQADALANPNDATHVATGSGIWSDPGIWQGGKVPGAEARVYVPDDVAVTYDLASSVPLKTIRVDGSLSWSLDTDTAMLVETIVTAPGSRTEMGTSDAPMPGSVAATVTFRDTPISNSDSGQLSHGLVAFGAVDINGSAKESFLKVAGGGVSAGATSVTVEGDATEWKVGDTLLLVGTEYVGENSYGVLQTQDEERVISAVDGNTISFENPLDHSHRPPAGFDFSAYVGNMSRNITFESENPDGVRGHVMLMNRDSGGSDLANAVRHAEFLGLGRTDKTVSINDSNPEGRYPLHLHQTGTDSDTAYSVVEGVAVSGSPGWGIVQHSSNALVNDSIVYDAVGGGIVSEAGDENGAWLRNMVTSTTGYDAPDKNGNGDQGAAYSNQSRAIVQQDNIAANSKIGWNFSGRENFPEDNPDKAPNDGIHRKMFDRDQLKFDPNPLDVAIDHEEPSITDFKGNEVIAATEGFRVYHRQFADDSDTMSIISDFDVWGGKDAVNLLNYAPNYQFMDSTWIGSGTAFTMWGKNSAGVLNNIDMHDFGLAYRSFGISHENVLYDVDMTNVDDVFDIKYDKDPSASWTEYFAKFGVDFDNPLPKVLNKGDLAPFEGLRFTLGTNKFGEEPDLILTPSDNELAIRGTITDGLGDRGFFENVVGSLSNQASSYAGAEMKLVNYDTTWHRNFSRDEFLDLHGTFQKADGTWVAPVVFWITERLEGKQYPVIVDVELRGFEEADLAVFELSQYPTPKIDNADFDYGFPEDAIVAVEPTTPEEPVAEDTSADEDGNLSVQGPSVAISADTVSSVVLALSGLDSDATAVISVSDGANTVVSELLTVDGEIVMDLSGLIPGSIDTSVTARDDAGNSVTVQGPQLDIQIEEPADTDTDSDGTLPQSGLVWQDLDGVSSGDIGDRDQINQSDAEGRTHALAFETGSDVTITQVVYEQGGTVRGLNFVIDNGTLYVGLWNKAEEDWGYKELSTNIQANTQYSSVLVMDGQLPSDGTATLYLNGTAVDTVSGVGKLYAHPDNIGVGQVAQNTLVHDSVQNGELRFSGSVDKLAHYNTALDGADLQNLNAVFAFADTEIVVDEPVPEDTSADKDGNLSVQGPSDPITADGAASVPILLSGLDSDATAVISVLDGASTATSGDVNSDGEVVLDLTGLSTGSLALSVSVTDDSGNNLTIEGPALTLEHAETVDTTEPVDTTGPGDTTDSLVSLEDAVTGSDENDYLNGTAGADVLIGLGGTDRLRGYEGDDTLVPGAGSDKLWGGAGADTFVFNTASLDGNSNDIKDFRLSEGDAIFIQDLLPDTMDAGEVGNFARFTDSGTLSVFEVDLSGNGDGFTELAIIRSGRGLTLEDMLVEDALLF